MNPLLVFTLACAMTAGTQPDASAPLGVFQFPHSSIPRMDGDFSDWDMVPDSYAVRVDRTGDDIGNRTVPDVSMKVGWVSGENRLYFLYEAYDDCWDFDAMGIRGDALEVAVDADRSGGVHFSPFRPDSPGMPDMHSYFTTGNVHEQVYTVMTPPAAGKSWAVVWGPQKWLGEFPWANSACDYSFSHGEGGKLRMEFYLTPFDRADISGPGGSVPSTLSEGKTIGLWLAVGDFDGGEGNGGSLDMSPFFGRKGDPAVWREFVLCPLEPGFKDGISAGWDHYVIPGTRTVRFEDRSEGEVDSYRWDFGDGCTSTQRNPFHTYTRDGVQYSVTLTVEGPQGSSRCCKVWGIGVWGCGKTDYSLLSRSDSLQVGEISSEEVVQYRKVGHHGPAVEDAGAAYRIYYNDSGAIDLYSKGGDGLELRKYLWYPTREDQDREGSGCDEYLVGKTVGLGGIALWDGKQEVKLAATRMRTARAGRTAEGAFAEMISYGVKCGRKTYDISVRVDVFDGSRVARVSATELGGRKLRFLTGVNYHPGESVTTGNGYAAVWGIHPADVSKDPSPIGAAILYDPALFPTVEQTPDMVRLISRPSASVSTRITAASTKEKGIDSEQRLLAFVRSLCGEE